MAHRRQRSRRALDLTALLAMVSTSSAVNLSQFQLIISNKGCKVKDFTSGRQCSARCVKGVQQTEDAIQEACGDLNISHKSLLGIALSGDLVDTLCPGLEPTTVTTTVHPSSTKGGFSTIVTAPTSFSTDTSRTTKKETSTTSTEKTSTSTSTSTSEQSTTTQSTTNQETSTPSTTTTATDSVTDTTSTQNTPEPTATGDSTSSDDDIPPPFFGTPFDPVPAAQQALGTVLSTGYGKEALMVAVCATLLLLR
ncbi:hypothetical protein Daesc_005214 [Daldinia eschscholtzii]|uniref:Uncharacterized protein n=1 Tax=Daldinia eschscholtzii TaxID=292717 RepID=A0AAX6MKI8_9PEZI